MTLDHTPNGRYMPGCNDPDHETDVMSAQEAEVRDRLWNHGISYQPIPGTCDRCGKPNCACLTINLSTLRVALFHATARLVGEPDLKPLVDEMQELFTTLLNLEPHTDVQALLVADEPF